ncbi:MAG: hypothetical protein CMG25_01550 [Candidatus Marinimicrobia bacterium]|nr:hypothetical protein [Candidatus Neomarinimicrobiota bacterium]
MKHPIFSIKKLKYDRNKKTVLDIKKIEIHRGSCYVFYGDVGAGKTTLLDVLSKRQKVSNDTVFYEQEDISKISSSKYYQDTCFVPQNIPQPWFKIKVKDYMLKKIKSYKHLTNPSKKLNEMVNKMKLNSYLDLDFKSLSDGEQRWIQLALSIACDTKVLFIDGFGQYLSAEKMSILSKILYRKINYDGVTVIVCTHIRERLSKIASVFIRMDHGKIISVRSHKKKTYKK